MPDGDNQGLTEDKPLDHGGNIRNGQSTKEKVKAKEIIKPGNKAMINRKKGDALDHANLSSHCSMDLWPFGIVCSWNMEISCPTSFIHSRK